jgi:hypothetical protein
LEVAIGDSKMLDDAVPVGIVGSLDIFVADTRGTSSAVGLGIEFVRSGIALTLPVVSRLVTTKPVVSGLESYTVGGTCTITEDTVNVRTPTG